MKISSDHSFAIFNRCRKQTKEEWTEILNLKKITMIQEKRVNEGVYNNAPGYRNGFLVFTEGGSSNGFWITDAEYKELLKNGIFGEFPEEE